MPWSGWAHGPWPLGLHIRSLCSAAGEATAVGGPHTTHTHTQKITFGWRWASLSSSPFLVHTPSREEGKHRTEAGGRQSALLTSWPPGSFILILSAPTPLPQRNPSGAEATHPTAMSKSLKKKSHWTSKVHESVIGRNPEGQLGFELKGGAENGQFPYLGEVKPGKVAYESGSKLVSEELLLEVNETPVAGLTIRDVLAVIKHCKDPLRLKCVKQGEGPSKAFEIQF
ncbi:splicing factor, arginine/serine-rich 15-like [Pontoporia blainvillei]|uniref:Splicing factor, arginine/serine-rich 15-like n=1 Tax=Pontoporia blainvillei TaxID=48723 RepID=A0ABX0S166_PONBL|nr:splicing factor, arginine/serine-rich 15-like [Pontoporia blainvillei]